MKKREKRTRCTGVDEWVAAGVREWGNNPHWTQDEAIDNARHVASQRDRRTAMGDRRHGHKGLKG
jgi:hypothetical protein